MKANPFNVYAVRHPAKRSWTFDRIVYLANGVPNVITIEADNMTRMEAEAYRATFEGMDVELGPLVAV